MDIVKRKNHFALFLPNSSGQQENRMAHAQQTAPKTGKSVGGSLHYIQPPPPLPSSSYSTRLHLLSFRLTPVSGHQKNYKAANCKLSMFTPIPAGPKISTFSSEKKTSIDFQTTVTCCSLYIQTSAKEHGAVTSQGAQIIITDRTPENQNFVVVTSSKVLFTAFAWFSPPKWPCTSICMICFPWSIGEDGPLSRQWPWPRHSPPRGSRSRTHQPQIRINILPFQDLYQQQPNPKASACSAKCDGNSTLKKPPNWCLRGRDVSGIAKLRRCPDIECVLKKKRGPDLGEEYENTFSQAIMPIFSSAPSSRQYRPAKWCPLHLLAKIHRIYMPAQLTTWNVYESMNSTQCVNL